ncbi:MAG: hypothetical protein ACP5P3_10220 [Ignavibacteria bacterium]
MKLLSLLVFLITLFLSTFAFAQVNQIQDSLIGFQLDFSNGWTLKSTEHTDAYDLVSYKVINHNDTNVSCLVLAFKGTFDDAKFDQFIYKLEYDANLLIPEKISNYEYFSGSNFDFKWASYMSKETGDGDIIYYLRTKNNDRTNLALMIRFALKKYDAKYLEPTLQIVKSFVQK